MPLWPRGVTVQIIVTDDGANPKYKYHVWWKTFKHTDDGDGDSADNECTTADIEDSSVHCGIAMKHDEWTQLKDTELQKEFGVYVKWNKCAMGKCVTTDNTGVKFARFDQWKIHVADIENCEYWISTEGERFITDDNANPPVCYNYGKCMPITTDATTVAEAQRRPQLVAPGLVSYDASEFTLSAEQDPYDGNRNARFTVDVEAGDIVRLLVDPADDTTWKDIRVTRIVSDTVLISDFPPDVFGAGATSVNYRILKCAAGRRMGSDASTHDLRTTSGSDSRVNARGLGPDEHANAYLPHPEHSYYQTWSYKYCEIDTGCCGFRVSSVVQPQQFAYYFVKPDHSNYNLRIAVHTVNDNLDLYTRRDDDGGGRPDYDQLSPHVGARVRALGHRRGRVRLRVPHQPPQGVRARRRDRVRQLRVRLPYRAWSVHPARRATQLREVGRRRHGRQQVPADGGRVRVLGAILPRVQLSGLRVRGLGRPSRGCQRLRRRVAQE